VTGLFLVLEGVEGVGKTTQARLLLQWMEELGLSVRLAREPGGTAAGEAIREILLDRGELDLGAETELLLLLAARAAFVREIALPVLRTGGILLADRFETSTLAYQGFGRGLDLDRIRDLNRFATQGLRPDLVLFLDLPWQVGRERQRREGKTWDRMESAGEDFLERVREGYRILADSEDRVVRIDAAPPVAEVQQALRGCLLSRFPEVFAGSRGGSQDPASGPLS
jgi:dTMP kinase